MSEQTERPGHPATRTSLFSAASAWARQTAEDDGGEASTGNWMLNGVVWQRCKACDHRLYPYVPLCTRCLSPDISWQRGSGVGRISDATQLHVSFDPEYRKRCPWPIGIVEHQSGPTYYVFLQNKGIGVGEDVQLFTAPDYSGEAVTIAVKPGDEALASARRLADHLLALSETTPENRG